jgi:uncharacterized membrane protein YheB (UPF0754 family)
MSWLQLFVAAISGLFTGWYTNKLALQLLFWPSPPKWGFGIFPAKKKELADKVGEIVATNVLTQAAITEHITSPELKKQIQDELRLTVRNSLLKRFETLGDLLAVMLPGKSAQVAWPQALERFISSQWARFVADNEAWVDIQDWLARKIERQRDKQLRDLLPSDLSQSADAWISLGCNALLDDPARLLEKIEGWLQSEKKLRDILDGMNPEIPDSLIQSAIPLLAEFVQKILEDEQVKQAILLRIPDLMKHLLDEGGESKNCFFRIFGGFIEQLLLDKKEEILARLPQLYPELIAKLKDLLNDPSLRADFLRQVRKQVDRGLEKSLGELWLTLPRDGRNFLLQWLGQVISSELFRQIIARQLHNGLQTILAMPLSVWIAPEYAWSPQRLLAENSNDQAQLPLKTQLKKIKDREYATVIGVIVPDPARANLMLAGLTQHLTNSRLTLLCVGLEIAEIEQLDPAITLIKIPTLGDSPTAPLLLFVATSEPMLPPETPDLLEICDGLVFIGSSLTNPQLILPELPPHQAIILLEDRRPDQSIVAGVYKNLGESSPELNSTGLAQQIRQRQLGTNAAIYGGDLDLAGLALLIAARDGILIDATGSHGQVEVNPELQKALRDQAYARAARLIGWTTLTSWLVRIKPELSRPRPANAGPIKCLAGPESPGLPDGAITPHLLAERLLAFGRERLTEDGVARIVKYLFNRLLAMKIGVMAEKIAGDSVENAITIITERIFSLLEEKSAAIAHSLKIEDLVRKKVLAIEDREIENAIKNKMAVGSFWWLELLGGVFGLIASILMNFFFQITPNLGLILCCVAGIATVFCLYRQKIHKEE